MKGEPYALGIDLGGSSIKAVAVMADGRVLHQRQVAFDTEAGLDWSVKIRDLTRQLQRVQTLPATAIGLSAPGLAAADQRSIAHMPGRLEGLEGLDWSWFLEAASPVPVLNDAHAALLGEAWIGAAHGYHNVVMLTLGTGVGGAAMVDGRLLRGAIGRAGHLGHMSLDPDGPLDVVNTPGSLELAIGNCSILERTRGRFRTTHELVAAHRAGNVEASAIWLKSVKALAAAICSFINILDPEVVILGGGVAQAGEKLFKPLQHFLERMEWRPGGHRVPVHPAQLAEFAGAFGAAHQAMNGAVFHE